LNAVAPKVAMMDEGLTWLFELLTRAETVPPNRKRPDPRKRRSRTARSS
jgi:hypothetical protein